MRLFATRAILLVATAMSCVGQMPGRIAVINYSGFNTSAPIAPGSLASVYGTFTGVATTSAAALNPLPRSLASVIVRVNSVDAPLYFVSAGQINFVVPFATPTGPQTVEVLNGANVVGRGTVQVFPYFPALASLAPTDATAPGVIQNQDFSINGAGTLARRGEVIQIYATGCGAVAPALADGAPGGTSPLNTVGAQVRVFVSVEEAPLLGAVAHPLFPGICQVNAFIPDRPYITGQLTMFVTVNGIASNPVSVWVE